MASYYNEIDPYAAQWLRNLIEAGHIAAGDVDTRSIADVKADDLKGYTQCHFFAGIGVWSHSLRQSGWADSRPVWTGSCPCQPFSVAGNGEGTNDERHLWPVWFELIKQCRPDVVFGEQVESAIKYGWLDLVQDDLEREDYSLGAVGIPAAGVGAPHIRHRLYFVAQSSKIGRGRGRDGDTPRYSGQIQIEGRSAFGELADAASNRRGGGSPSASIEKGWATQPEQFGQLEAGLERRAVSGVGRAARMEVEQLADDLDTGSQGWLCGRSDEGRQDQHGHTGRYGTTGFWGAADWIDCKDGKTRPVEPSTFPLAYGAPARVGRLRAYGNAIVPQAAQAVIEAYLET
jgi:DNA (cytosine-5)-methyltransferase 1